MRRRVTIGGWGLVGLLGVALAQANAAAPIPPLTLPAGARVMLFAPHPDDETLAAGGLLFQLARAGTPLRIVFLTNGDGYPRAVTQEVASRAPTDADYLAFGTLRQREARAALARLGVAPREVSFLGFPDGGLAELWRPHWAQPYTSPFTRWDHPPYQGAVNRHADYEGRDLTAVIERLMREFRPTVVLMPHPEDTHLDHAHAGYFVTEALTSLQGAGVLPPRLVVLGYLVHYGPGTSWPPIPARERLLPPRGLSGTTWVETKLDSSAVAAKRAALAEYPSQLKVLGTFMRSFATRNELFARIDPQVLARIASIH